MNLFPYETTRNLLPFDGIANYSVPFWSPMFQPEIFRLARLARPSLALKN